MRECLDSVLTIGELDSSNRDMLEEHVFTEPGITKFAGDYSNTLVLVLYISIGFLDLVFIFAIFLKVLELTVKHPWLIGRHGNPIILTFGNPSCISIPLA